MAERFDTIVVGGSPAGFIAAIAIAQEGLTVALIQEPVEIQGVRLLSIPAMEDALDLRPLLPTLMQTITQVRRVTTDGDCWAATEFGTPEKSDADLVSVEMDDFLTHLTQMADEAGVSRRSGALELIRDDSGRVQGCRTADGDELLALVTIVADPQAGGFADELAPPPTTYPEDDVLFAEASWLFRDGVIADLCSVPDDQGVLTSISGDILGGLASASAWLYPGRNTITVGVVLPRALAERSELTAATVIDRITAHPAFGILFEYGKREKRNDDARDSEVRPRGGVDQLRTLFGDGWLLVGDAAAIADPRHPYELRMELTSGRAAAETAIAAAEIDNASAITLGLYKRMLLDSYVFPEMKSALAEIRRREKNPDLDGYYPALLTRRLALDLRAGLEPRGRERKEFAEEMLTERPLWDLIKAGIGGYRLFG